MLAKGLQGRIMNKGLGRREWGFKIQLGFCVMEVDQGSYLRMVKTSV